MELNEKCPFGEGNNYQSAAYDSKFIQFTSEGTSLPSSDQNGEAENRSELKTSSAGIHLSSIEGRASIRLFVTERLLISTDVEDVLELPDERYESVTWSSPDPYRYVMFIFNFSAVSCKEAVEVILG
ncbi:N-succinylglutamate 5-semialdehyde dehydrogenase [Trichinella pseudospiralis]